MDLSEIEILPVEADEEPRFRALMDARHYLGAAPKIGETVWYAARCRDDWVALLSFSAAALKCRARDDWIGWDFRHKYDRLHLVANNTRFLLLRPVPNLGSRVLSLCERRLAADWPARYGHRIVLLETFIDARYFRGTVYRAANWFAAGETLGYRRVQGGYRAGSTPKTVLLRPLVPNAREVLAAPVLDPQDRHGLPGMRLTAREMESLFHYFRHIEDPRGSRGRRYLLASVLSLWAAATLCGASGPTEMHLWAKRLPQRTLRYYFRCRMVGGRADCPSITCFRLTLLAVPQREREAALDRWRRDHSWDAPPGQ